MAADMYQLAPVWSRARRITRRIRRVITSPDEARRAPDIALGVLWERLPPYSRRSRFGIRLGHLIYRRVRARQPRSNSEYTRFLRNQPLFDRSTSLAIAWPSDGPLRVAVLGCSAGAELYSAMWAIRSVRPDLHVEAAGVDSSESALRTAARGEYTCDSRELADLPDRLVVQMLEPAGSVLTVRRPYRESVSWHLLDVGDPALVERLGERDLVLGNNVFIHLPETLADAALRNSVALLAPGAYLVTYGVDLDVKTRVVRSCGLVPDEGDISAIYEANERALARWPLKSIGCEPMDTTRPDWQFRYASVYRRPERGAESGIHAQA